MSLDELFEWVDNELRCQERSDSYGKYYPGWRDNRAPERRETRAVDTRSEPNRSHTPSPTPSLQPDREKAPQQREANRGSAPPRRVPTRGAMDTPYPRGKGKGKGDNVNQNRAQEAVNATPAATRPQVPPTLPPAPTPPPLSQIASAGPSSGPSWACNLCGDPGHYARACPKFGESRCFRCNEMGHWRAECPMAGRRGTPFPRGKGE